MKIHSEISKRPARRGRLVLLAIVALFVLPVLAAIVLNSRWTDWQPEPTRNNGRLVEPATPLPAPLVEALALEPEWTLITARAECPDDCLTVVDQLARLDRALGRHAEEVRQLLLAPGSERVPEGIVAVDWRPVPAGWPAFLADLHAAGALAGDTGALLVDPRGNAMLAYPSEFDPSEVRKDLGRLLRYSKFNES